MPAIDDWMRTKRSQKFAWTAGFLLLTAPEIPAQPQTASPGPATVSAPPVATISVPASVPPLPATPSNALVFDSELKELTAKVGETNIQITFWLTNTHSTEVVIYNVSSSCGCTVAKLPAQPWHVPAGGAGPIDAFLDLSGKSGTLNKKLTLESSSGYKSLLFKVTILDGHSAVVLLDPDREKNIHLTLADRQVVFKNAECAKCHAEPARGKLGRDLYQTACGICHESAQRATMVPDLRSLTHPTNPAHWRTWITDGRSGSLMPAFAKSQGGPLTDDQIESLVTYLIESIPTRLLEGRPRTTQNPDTPGASAQPSRVTSTPRK
jgi:cytochrome c5